MQQWRCAPERARSKGSAGPVLGDAPPDGLVPCARSARQSGKVQVMKGKQALTGNPLPERCGRSESAVKNQAGNLVEFFLSGLRTVLLYYRREIRHRAAGIHRQFYGDIFAGEREW